MNLIIHVTNKINRLTEGIFFSHWFILMSGNSVVQKRRRGGKEASEMALRADYSWDWNLTVETGLVVRLLTLLIHKAR